MLRWRSLRQAISATALALIAVSFAGSAFAADRPNFVFFLVDDLGQRDLGVYGSAFYETPNVDRLAATGMRFTDAYAACPVCSPTRGSILTGRYPTRLGITDFIGGGNQPENWKRNTVTLPAAYSDRLALEETTIAEALKQAGYATCFAGKWHLGGEGYLPTDQGFDLNFGGLDRGGPYGGDKYFSPYGNPYLTDGPKGEHLPDRLATEISRFIEANRERPFLAYLSFYSVHTPLMSREDLRQKYAEKAKQVVHDGPRTVPEGSREARQVQDHAVYGGMVEAMDLAVGKVLDTLDRLGLAENTVVIFMSDNGGLSTSEGSPTSNLPLRGGKGWLYEGGIREPMIIRAPGVTEPGSVCDEPVVSTDFFPTILELAGEEPQPDLHLDGVDLGPLLKNPEARLDREAIYWHYPHHSNQGGPAGGAVRTGDWKLIEHYDDDGVELYRLADDLGERCDLAEEHPEIVARLKAKLAAWREETGALMPTPNPAYDPAKPNPNTWSSTGR